MKIGVRLIYTDADGVTHHRRQAVLAAHTVDAINILLDIMEMEGVDINAIRAVSMIAKPYPEGVYLVGEFEPGIPQSDATPRAA